MILGYESLSNSDRHRSQEKADDIIKNGWELKGYDVVDLQRIPWGLKDLTLRSWSFHIHSWDMLEDILVSLEETNEQRFLDIALLVVTDWLDYIEEPEAENSMAWYDMAVPLRAYRLAFIYDYLNSKEPEHKTLVLVWESIQDHMSYLNDKKNIHFHNNHGYYQVAGHLAISRRFRHKDESFGRAHLVALSRLRLMLDQQFKKDGGHVEHSPDYHRMVVETLSGMVKSEMIDDDNILSLIDTIESSLAWFIDQSGYLSNVGDTDRRAMLSSAKFSSSKWKSPAMRFAASKGRAGVPPEAKVKVFPETGYYIYKDWKETSNYSYLLQQMGFHSRTHKHADDLSFIWSDRGEQIFTDSGRYGYSGKTTVGSELWERGFWYDDPQRIHCESTRAHSTLEFDNSSYNRKINEAYGSAYKRSVSISGLQVVESKCDHGEISRTRTLIYLPKEFLIVFDWFRDETDGRHSVKQWFNVAPQNQVEKLANRCVVTTPKGQSIQCVTTACEDPEINLHIGEVGNKLVGWYSRDERELSPCYAFNFEEKNKKSGSFLTHLTFSKAFESIKTVVDNSGRSMEAMWLDDNGSHELRIKSPPLGELEVQYNRL